MFTGIVETTGVVLSHDFRPELSTLCVQAPTICQDLHLGDSIAVNGVCLTAVAIDPQRQHFSVQMVPETLSRTNLGELRAKDAVNLERSLRADTRMGGHFVQGHIDATTKIISVEPQGEAKLLTFELPKQYAAFIVNKGFIAIDGMSLTVIEATHTQFTVTLIPYTLEHTIAKRYAAGTIVNLEIDILAKYVSRCLEFRNH